MVAVLLDGWETKKDASGWDGSPAAAPRLVLVASAAGASEVPYMATYAIVDSCCICHQLGHAEKRWEYTNRDGCGRSAGISALGQGGL